MTKSHQNGNALWIVLIGIVLIGTITAMFVRTSSTSEDTGNYEQDSIAASEIMRYTTGVASAVQGLVARGCSEGEISFWTDTNGDGAENASDTYYNASAPTGRTCHVFFPEGGGQTLVKPKVQWLDTSKSAKTDYGQWIFNGSLYVRGDGGGASQKDLLIFLPYAKKSICMQINTNGKINNPSSAPPAEDNTPNADFIRKFTGTYGGGNDLDGYGSGGDDIFGYKNSGCTTASDETSYHAFTILINR